MGESIAITSGKGGVGEKQYDYWYWNDIGTDGVSCLYD